MGTAWCKEPAEEQKKMEKLTNLTKFLMKLWNKHRLFENYFSDVM